MEDRVYIEMVRELQGNIPFEENPYEELGKRLGISEDEVVERLKELVESNRLKRIGAVLRHKKSGYSYNAMAVFKADAAITESMGMELASSRLSSHCYERKSYDMWPYNLYVMLHSRTENEIEKYVEEIAKKYGLYDYKILYSERELKKTSMIYY